jgi:DNA repair protein RadC
MNAQDALTKATKSYAQNVRDWKFLGYSEPLAIAILAEFFSLKKVRNPSPKPLNVLSMVGKSRVVQLRDEIESALRAQAESTAEATETEPDVLESEEESSEGG